MPVSQPKPPHYRKRLACGNVLLLKMSHYLAFRFVAPVTPRGICHISKAIK